MSSDVYWADLEYCADCPAALFHEQYRSRESQLVRDLAATQKTLQRLQTEYKLKHLKAEIDKQRRELEMWNRLAPFFRAALEVHDELALAKAQGQLISDYDHWVLNALNAGLDASEPARGELPPEVEALVAEVLARKELR